MNFGVHGSIVLYRISWYTESYYKGFLLYRQFRPELSVSFRTVTQVWIHRLIWNDAQSLTLYRRSALLFFKVMHQISRSHRLKNQWFESNLRLPGWSQISNPSDLPLLVQGHPLNFKVTWDKNSPILTDFDIFQYVSIRSVSRQPVLTTVLC